MDKQKVIVYVDGFNFYYGLRKNRWRKYYWIDMVRLFVHAKNRPYFAWHPENREAILPSDDPMIEAINNK